MELIRLENIHKTYYLGEVDVPVLKGISISINRGEMVALMGASGSGKTTLMNILGCLDHPSSGKFWLDGEEMSNLTPNQRAIVRTTKIGFVFQNFNLLPRTSALQNVIMPLDYNPQRPVASEARRLGGILLDRLGLADRSDHEPSQMSGGQQQRVAIARSLVNQPSLVLADEPTGNLDSHTSVEILEMFQQLNTEGITVILVTHDPNVAAYAHRVIRISDGLVENDGSNKSGNGDNRPAADTDHEPATVRPALRKSMTLMAPHTFITALKALKRNKMRSALTALGVII
ncbi:MAG: ABC transporter ATP-binding protein, partial [Thermoguttaceae bacterium]